MFEAVGYLITLACGHDGIGARFWSGLSGREI
jgi:hypothetical protein